MSLGSAVWVAENDRFGSERRSGEKIIVNVFEKTWLRVIVDSVTEDVCACIKENAKETARA